MWIALFLLAAGAAVIGFTVWPDAGPAENPLAENPGKRSSEIPGESFPDEGSEHIDIPQKVTYQTDPPTSGPHYSGVVRPGFHTETALPELLVHNLEHGNIVIYYDPEGASEETLKSLRELADRYRGTFDGVVVVPHTDPQNPIILTAWRHMLRLPAWDPKQVDAFIDAYRGRGPEKKVR
ncbi:MAG: DUF3105 domain-containing protein [Firmicutes bacterium]|nr:DUF3105 domain-containing protein [Bacillota bacterium]